MDKIIEAVHTIRDMCEDNYGDCRKCLLKVGLKEAPVCRLGLSLPRHWELDIEKIDYGRQLSWDLKGDE